MKKKCKSDANRALVEACLPFCLPATFLIFRSESDNSDSLSDSPPIFGSIFFVTGAIDTDGVRLPVAVFFIGIRLRCILP